MRVIENRAGTEVPITLKPVDEFADDGDVDIRFEVDDDGAVDGEPRSIRGQIDGGIDVRTGRADKRSVSSTTTTYSPHRACGREMKWSEK